MELEDTDALGCRPRAHRLWISEGFLLHAGFGRASYFLPRLVGSGLAADPLLAGNFITAEPTEWVGLSNALVGEAVLLQDGMDFAGDMLGNSPKGRRLTRTLP
jgi:enoyl-CoA hydratase/carnithine racemase